MKDGEGEDERWRGGSREKSMERKNRKSETTIFYHNLTHEHQ